jgi:hypothetical protein
VIIVRNIPVTPFVALLAVTLSFAQSDTDFRISDDSDWWSIIRKNSTHEVLKPQHQDVDESNFQVLGVAVGRDDLEAIQQKLGAAHVINRGDASTGRSQICYAGLDGQTYLTFEIGEVQYGAYLFNHGPRWSGSDQCAKCEFVTSALKTTSGLRLGQTPAGVQAILGKPTTARRNGDFVYFRQLRKRTSAVDLEKARRQYPNMNEKEFHETYDYYDASFFIVARFSGSRLVYLGLSKADTD